MQNTKWLMIHETENSLTEILIITQLLGPVHRLRYNLRARIEGKAEGKAVTEKNSKKSVMR